MTNKMETGKKEILFSEVKIGQRFYDYETGAFWTKINEANASMDSGFFVDDEDYCEDVECFLPDEIVCLR